MRAGSGGRPLTGRSSNAESPATRRKRVAALTLGALGVVFGDIGTSPLYALRECSERHLAAVM